MASYTPVLTKTVRSSGAVSAKRFIGYDGAQIGSAGAAAYGVSLFNADDGEALSVVVMGTAIVETGGAVSKGDKLTADANGKAIVATAGNVVNAIALEDASGAGQEIEVLLVPAITTVEAA